MHNNKELIDEYRNRLVNLHAVTVLFISVLEIAAYFILHIDSNHAVSLRCTYLWIYVLLPIAVNGITHMVARFLCCKSAASPDTKNSSIIYAALITACVVTFFHRVYMATACSFTLPLVLSGMFDNRTLLNKSFNFTAISLIAVTAINIYENTVDVDFILNHVVIYGINFISYLSAVLAISFSDNSLEIIQQQAHKNKELQHSMRRDQMTGLYNHETFYVKLNDAINDYHSGNYKFCLLMMDIDDFKQFNDTYGHDEGDAVLKSLVDAMRSCCDSNDRLCRYGGEEFTIIFGNKSLEAAKAVAENILSAFSNTRYSFTQKRTTFSAGIAEFDGSMTAENLFDKVDELMYKAKKSGKNKIVTE